MSKSNSAFFNDLIERKWNTKGGKGVSQLCLTMPKNTFTLYLTYKIVQKDIVSPKLCTPRAKRKTNRNQ